MPPKQQFNVYLPSELVRCLKHTATEQNRALSTFVEIALRRYFEAESRTGDPCPHRLRQRYGVPGASTAR